MDVATLSVLLVFGIPIIAIVGGIFLSALKILKGDGKRKSASNDAEEARMIQDIYHGLVKMEQRVESLETLLLDRQRKGNES
jgi:phage shock protein B